MMNHCIKDHPLFGQTLYADNGIVEVGIPLEYGIRIGHFSFVGEDNLFFEHPNDMDDFTTEEGWRHHGGHRLWIAPESEADYYPDNDPVEYRIEGERIIITQKEDPWLRVMKEIEITFEDSSIKVLHRVTNTSDTPRECGLWSISTLRAGGVEYIDLPLRDGGMDPWIRMGAWDYTSYGDERIKYTREQVTITHLPIDARLKIGFGHPISPVRYEVGGVVFLKHFTVDRDAIYPDSNLSYEAFFSKYMTEMESLSPLGVIGKGESMTHTEVLELRRK